MVNEASTAARGQAGTGAIACPRYPYPMRAVLLVHPTSLDTIDEVVLCQPDAFLLDVAGCEPKVLLTLVGAIRTRERPVLLRIRPLAEGGAGDLACAMHARADAVWLRDTVGRAQVEQLASRLAVAEAELDLRHGGTRIVASIESARGALALARLAEVGTRLAAIALDAQALAADLRCRPEEPGLLPAPVRATQAQAVIVAAASNVPAIDATQTPPPPEEFAAEAAVAVANGFSGKLALDPAQVAALRRSDPQPPFGRWMENFVSGVATK